MSSTGTYTVKGHDHEYEDIADTCIWCGVTKHPDGGMIACKRRRKRVKATSDEILSRRIAKTVTTGQATLALGEGVTPTGGHGKGKAVAGRCYETHPPLVIDEGLPPVYGGSCGHPAVADADVYIGFDGNMKQTYRSFPWKKGDEFLYHISDMSPPKDEASFVKMLKWVHAQLEAGAKVHAGCIGGHGRTGLFFAALRYHITGDENAIEYVREHYCKKAVESEKQVNFLAKLGLKKAKPTKSFSSSATYVTSSSGALPSGGGYQGWSGSGTNSGTMLKLDSGEERATPIPCNGNVWGSALDEV